MDAFVEKLRKSTYTFTYNGVEYPTGSMFIVNAKKVMGGTPIKNHNITTTFAHRVEFSDDVILYRFDFSDPKVPKEMFDCPFVCLTEKELDTCVIEALNVADSKYDPEYSQLGSYRRYEPPTESDLVSIEKQWEQYMKARDPYFNYGSFSDAGCLLAILIIFAIFAVGPISGEMTWGLIIFGVLLFGIAGKG